eukprot:scaffold62550_cov60-Phaeocystis_antarctica.AAC.8
MSLRSGGKPSHLALPPGAGPDATFRFVTSLSRLSSGVTARPAPRPRPRPRPTSPIGLGAEATPLPRPRPALEKRDLSATPASYTGLQRRVVSGAVAALRDLIEALA